MDQRCGWPANHSLSSVADKSLGCSVLRKLAAKSDLLVPANPMLKPREKPVIKEFSSLGS